MADGFLDMINASAGRAGTPAIDGLSGIAGSVGQPAIGGSSGMVQGLTQPQSSAGTSRGLSQSGADAIGAGIQLAGSIGTSIAQSQSDKALQEQSQMLSGLAEEQAMSQQNISQQFAESSVALQEKAFDIQKMQNTFANRMKALRKELANSLKKKKQLEGLGMAMKDKMSQDEQYKDVMINSFREGGGAESQL